MIIATSPTTRPKRISKQICRIVAIMEVLHRLDEADIGQVRKIVNAVLPFPICERTVRRDLEAMEAIGVIERSRFMFEGKIRRVWKMNAPERVIELCNAEKQRRATR